MDLNPGREPHMMARWTLFGSLGDLIGPLILAAGLSLAWGWRWAFLALAGLALLLSLQIWRGSFPDRVTNDEVAKENPQAGLIATVKSLLVNLKSALTNRNLLRWVGLLWYCVLQGEAYASAPERSGAVMAVNSLVGVVGAFFPWLIGWSAGYVGLAAAMWILLLGPFCLTLFVPRPANNLKFENCSDLERV